MKKIIVAILAAVMMLSLMAAAVADAFRYSKLVLATTTYNAGIFPPMREYINWLLERNFSNRHIAFIENASWAPVAIKKMQEQLDKLHIELNDEYVNIHKDFLCEFNHFFLLNIAAWEVSVFAVNIICCGFVGE